MADLSYPVYLSAIRGYDSLMIGETMFVSGLAMFFTAPIAGIMSRKLDPRVMMMIGFFGFGCGTLMMTRMTADWDFWELFVPQVLRGCSMMIAMVPINNVALGTLPPDRIRNASGLYNLSRNLGGAVGLAVINTMLTRQTRSHYEQLSEHVQWGRRKRAIWSLHDQQVQRLGMDGSTIAIKKLAGWSSSRPPSCPSSTCSCC